MSHSPNEEAEYASLPTKDPIIAAEAEAVAELAVEQAKFSSVNPEYANLPEACSLTWNDTFFDDEDDIVAVFDFDYDAMISFNTKSAWVVLALTSIYWPVLLFACVFLIPCYLRQNVIWEARAQHLAVTRDGIRYVRNRRPFLCGLPCSNLGKTSKTVPFEMITDCDVMEPAGNSWICIRNVLHTVSIDTASSGHDGRKELRLSGLCNPYGFKKLVWAMKRAQRSGTNSKEELGSSSSASLAEMTILLREIRDELRNKNKDEKQNLDEEAVLPGVALAVAAATEEATIV